MRNILTSLDGKQLSYETTGSGPAVIIIPGALEEIENFQGLAKELSKLFTVYTLDRRGHGTSVPQDSTYSIEQECQDIATLQQQTSAAYLFGHSYGGFVALETARHNPAITSVVVYEPGVCIDGSINVSWVEQCRRELDAERFHDAFTTFAQGINPQSANMPRFLFKHLLKLVMKPGELTQKYRLLSTAIAEHLEEARLNNSYSHYQEIPGQVLIMRGSNGMLSDAVLDKLVKSIPQTAIRTFKGLDHFVPETHPEQIAPIMAQFFQGGSLS